jgi:hypothetical protein
MNAKVFLVSDNNKKKRTKNISILLIYTDVSNKSYKVTSIQCVHVYKEKKVKLVH